VSISDDVAALRATTNAVPIGMLNELRDKLAEVDAPIAAALGDSSAVTVLRGIIRGTDKILAEASRSMHHLVEQINSVADYHTG
jgi:hypothetical protein